MQSARQGIAKGYLREDPPHHVLLSIRSRADTPARLLRISKVTCRDCIGKVVFSKATADERSRGSQLLAPPCTPRYTYPMILSDRDIKKALQDGRIKLTPAPDLATQLGSCSLDLHLGNEFQAFRRSKVPCIDIRDTDKMREIMESFTVPEGDPVVLQPGELLLATTVEWLEIADDLVGRIEGRSSLGRLGIIVHGTASVFDPGWRGKPVVELGNLGVMPVLLYPGMRVCSFTFEEVSSKVEVPYYLKKNNKYAGQETPLASKLYQETEKAKKNVK